MKNAFLEKSCTECGEETNPRPFSKKSRLIISLEHYSKISYSLFLLYVQVAKYQNLLKRGADHLILSHIKLF